jgi:hypothetical protein
MKTARRQELRTNELSTQLDNIGEYVKTNTTMFTVVVVAAALAVLAVYWFTASRKSSVMEAWSEVRKTPGQSETPDSVVDRLREVADKKIDPALTCEAQVRIGTVALNQLMIPDKTAPGTKDWGQIAESTFTTIVKDFPNNTAAVAQANISLGLIAEKRGDMSKAREFYNKVAQNKTYDGSPYADQAQFRIKNLDSWSEPVVFAPPPPKIIATSAPTMSLPGPGESTMMQIPINPTPAPTTQPAGN